MKKYIRFLSLFLLTAITFSFSSCKLSVVSAEKLLRPPKSGIEIENAIEDFAGESIVLKNPVNSSSEYTSSITLADLDSDGEEEAVVFYATTSNETSVHLNVLKRISDEWVSIGDFSGYGNNIETVSLKNLSKDMTSYDIVTTWSYIDSKMLTIHKVSGSGRRSELKLVCDMPYASMGYVDVDKDGFNEIFLINGDFADKTKVPTAKIVRIEKYNIINIGMISLSREIVGYINSYCQEIKDENVSMIAVYDYVNSDGYYGTDVVYWDNESSSLNLMHVNSADNSAFSTLRELPIYSNDVNADTFIEIPVQEPVVGSNVTGNTDNTILSYTNWCNLVPTENGIELEKCCNSRFYFTDKDYLDVDNDLADKITVSRNADKDSWSVLTYSPDISQVNKVLLNVRIVNRDEHDDLIDDGYKQLSSPGNENKFILYKISDVGRAMGIEDEDLVNIKL